MKAFFPKKTQKSPRLSKQYRETRHPCASGSRALPGTLRVDGKKSHHFDALFIIAFVSRLSTSLTRLKYTA